MSIAPWEIVRFNEISFEHAVVGRLSRAADFVSESKRSIIKWDNLLLLSEKLSNLEHELCALELQQQEE